MPKLFYEVLANSLAASVTNTFVWFAVTFWVYLETRSVTVTSVMAGVYHGPAVYPGRIHWPYGYAAGDAVAGL